jgi:hypothetical protein
MGNNRAVADTAIQGQVFLLPVPGLVSRFFVLVVAFAPPLFRQLANSG